MKLKTHKGYDLLDDDNVEVTLYGHYRAYLKQGVIHVYVLKFRSIRPFLRWSVNLSSFCSSDSYKQFQFTLPTTLLKNGRMHW